MNLYSFDIPIHATVYVKANSPQEAREKAKAISGEFIEIAEQTYGDGVEVSGLAFDNPHLPEIALSPAMTIGKIAETGIEGLATLAEEDVPETVEE